MLRLFYFESDDCAVEVCSDTDFRKFELSVWDSNDECQASIESVSLDKVADYAANRIGCSPDSMTDILEAAIERCA